MAGQVWAALAIFAAAAVECVEALTIVLAVGVTRGFRAPLLATAAAVLALAVLVVSLGGVLTTRVPEQGLKLAIGVLLLLFGLRWLHKAVLRSAGVIALHDEAAEYRETVGALQGSVEGAFDWAGALVAFKGVFLEGVEVVFIVVAAGASSGRLVTASLAAVAAALVVAGVGVLVRHPLTRVPENTLKTGVGVALSSLGTFWAAEGMGTTWPHDAVWVPVLAAIYLGASRLAVMLIRGGTVVAPA